MTPGRRPVTHITGIGQRLVGRQSTRRQQIEDALLVLTARYEEKHGHAPGERAVYTPTCQAVDRTRSPKRTEPLSPTELRRRGPTSAIRTFGARTVHRLAEHGNRAQVDRQARSMNRRTAYAVPAGPPAVPGRVRDDLTETPGKSVRSTAVWSGRVDEGPVVGRERGGSARVGGLHAGALRGVRRGVGAGGAGARPRHQL